MIRDLEDARDDALESLDRSQWEMDRMKRDFEYQLLKVRESMREEFELKYKRDIKTRYELIELLKAKVSEGSLKLRSGEHTVSVINGRESHSSGGRSNEPEAVEDLSRANHFKLPALPKFNGDDKDAVDSLKRWLAKLEKHAELQCWTEREKLVQFELHLAGRAERVYEVFMSRRAMSGPERAILDCYGHCVRSSVNKLGGSGGMLPQEIILKLGTLRSLLRPCLGQYATRISPPVVSVAREAIEPSCQK